MLKKINPYIFIIMTFLITILIGTLLLALPIASTSGISFGFVDSLFMATSAVCVTGLAVVNVAFDMTLFGKIVMCLLMEVGGLSFITIAVFFFTIIGAKIGLSNRFLIKEALNQNSLKGIVSLVRKIVFISLAIQFIGVCFNMFSMMPYTNYNFFKALGYSVFHAISAFNNSGFDAFGADSLISFKDDWVLNLSTMFLIICGSMGFVCYDEILKKKRFKKFNLHTKLAIISTIVLIVLGTALYKLSFSEMSFLQCMFASVTARTAGFATVDYGNVSGGAYILTLILMFIGASPCSTGGGVKTTTIAVVFLAIVSYSFGKRTTVFKRRISDNNVLKALLLCIVGLIIILIGTFLITCIQPELPIDKVVFEVTSAFSTTGLSMGITSSLAVPSRIIICFIMFFGRLGPLTIIGVVNRHWMSPNNKSIEYVEEGVIIG